MGNKLKTNSRRIFLKQSAQVAAITVVPRYVLGGPLFTAPSDQIAIGVIGCGKQSRGLISNFLGMKDAKIIANSDVDQQKKEAFAKFVNDRYAETSDQASYKAISSYTDYTELIARDDIDAVLVITPDHWHAINSIQAMQSGKDVYCEKPMAHTVVEGRKMIETTQKYGRVFQTGSMQRSWKDFRRACELVRNGFIGDVRIVKVNVGDPAIPCDLEAEDTPDYLDWNTWLGPAPQRPYSSVLSPPITYDGWPMWRSYWEYGGGGVADWGAHMFDIAQWGLGMDETGPVQLITPKEIGVTRGLKFVYANGVEMVHEDFGRGWAVEFIGSEGVIRISREFLESDPSNILSAEVPQDGIKLYYSDDHYKNWIDCIKSREQPVCDAETGHRTATVCNIGNIAYKLGRDLKWDPVKENFVGDKEADGFLTRKYRKPFIL
jgi:predicted dehydrogenase